MAGSATDNRLHFLLELWLEPREIQGAPLSLRGRVRDLISGREAFVGTFEDVERFVDAALDAVGATNRRWAGQADNAPEDVDDPGRPA